MERAFGGWSHPIGLTIVGSLMLSTSAVSARGAAGDLPETDRPAAVATDAGAADPIWSTHATSDDGRKEPMAKQRSARQRPSPSEDRQIDSEEIRRIQKALGGSILEQGARRGLIDNLLRASQPSEPPPTANEPELGPPMIPPAQATIQRRSIDPQQGPYVRPAPPPPRMMVHPRSIPALREAAQQLDESANRLENLDLFAQADALRELAQRLRVDARTQLSSAGVSTAEARTNVWNWPVPAREPAAGDELDLTPGPIEPRPRDEWLQPPQRF